MVSPPRRRELTIQTRLGSKVALLAGSFVICVLFLEIAFRVLGFEPLHAVYSKPEMFWQRDNLLGWSHTPGAKGIYAGPRPWPIEFKANVRINDDGLRGPEIARDLSRKRVLVLGDSVVAGFEVEEENHFTTILSKRLTEATGETIDVINAGVRGYGTDQTYLYFRERGKKLHPNVVVLFNSNNDFDDNTTLHRTRRPFGKAAFALDKSGQIVSIGNAAEVYDYCSAVHLSDDFTIVRTDTLKGRLACGLETLLADRSAFFTYLAMKIRQSPSIVSLLHRAGDAPEDHSSHAPNDTVTTAVRLTARLVRAISDDVRSTGAAFVMVGREADLEKIRTGGFYTPELVTLETIENDNTPLTFLRDSHFNNEGHRRLAEVLFAKLFPLFQEKAVGEMVPEGVPTNKPENKQ